MATKKKPAAKAKLKAKPRTPPPPPKKAAAPRGSSPKVLPPAFSPGMLEEALDEPLADMSGAFRVQQQLRGSQRDTDEDQVRQFADPSLVMRAIRDEDL
jgi:hypothetical protein